MANSQIRFTFFSCLGELRLQQTSILLKLLEASNPAYGLIVPSSQSILINHRLKSNRLAIARLLP